MELYLLIGLFVIYFITLITTSKATHKKIWTLAFLLSFFIMGICIVFLRANHHSSISIWGLDEYYILYLNGSITFLLGIINMWMYKIELYHILKKD